MSGAGEVVDRSLDAERKSRILRKKRKGFQRGDKR